MGVLGYADDVTLLSPSIRGLGKINDVNKQVEYHVQFNEKKTVAIRFISDNTADCYLNRNRKCVKWVGPTAN